jgi:RimJ/RimL family protein N-acetyltransferase
MTLLSTTQEQLQPAATTASTIRALKLDCPVIETGRLLLRPPHEEDIEDMVRLANNYAVARMLASMPHPYFAADAREYLEKLAKGGTGDKGDCVYAITDAATGAFMGLCGLHDDPARFELPFLGYWLGEPHWGSGYASEAARAMVCLFFKVTAGETLMASCRNDNAASRAIIVKCGGRYWKSGQSYNAALGELQNVDHFRITRESWMEAAGQ